MARSKSENDLAALVSGALIRIPIACQITPPFRPITPPFRPVTPDHPKAEGPESSLSKAMTRVDYLALLGDHVLSRASLYSLCLVSRGMNSVFAPLLYARIHLHGPGRVPLEDTVDHMIASDLLVYTKVLEIDEFLSPTLREKTERHLDSWLVVQLQLVRLTSCTPNLKKIVWRNTHISSWTVRKISEQCPRIEHVFSDSLSNPMERIWLSAQSSEVSYLRQFEGLAPFSNLTSLNLHHFRGDPSKWKRNIVEVLLQAPGLVELGLSMHLHDVFENHITSTGCDPRNGPCITEHAYANFFPSVCQRYVGYGGRQLKLKTLKLGTSMLVVKGLVALTGMPFSELHKWQGLHVLSKFTDLTKLNNISIFNRGVISSVDGKFHCLLAERDGISRVDWLFSYLPKLCPDLQILSVLTLDPSMALAISQLDRGYVSRLGIRMETWSMSPWPDPRYRYRSMFGIFNPQVLGVAPRALWLPRLSYCERADINTLAQLTSIRTLSLETPRIFFDVEFIDALAGMENLEHLWLRCGMCRYELYWPAATLQKKRQVERDAGRSGRLRQGHLSELVYFDDLAAVCPRLRYLRVCNEAYAVIRHQNPPLVKLRLLDDWEDEVEAPEFFRFEPPPTHALDTSLRGGRYW